MCESFWPRRRGFYPAAPVRRYHRPDRQRQADKRETQPTGGVVLRCVCAAPLLAALAAALTLSASAVDAKTLRWAGRGDMQTTDPHSQNENLTNNINQLVYEFLLVRDKKLGLQPSLAESWTKVNPTTWRFKLRPGVKFHDGAPFTADDVVFSFERARSDSSQL